MTKSTTKENQEKKYVVKVVSTILLTKIAQVDFNTIEEIEAYIQKRKKTDGFTKYFVSYNWGLSFEAY